MKSLLKCLMALGLICQATTILAQESQLPKNGKIYIVRHAEKDTGTNPGLTLKGRQRAGDLYQLLKNESIDVIFITKYKRSMMTADSLISYQHSPVIVYVADTTGKGFAEAWEKIPTGARNILVIGHSNTVPALIRKSGAAFSPAELPETEFDQLFIIKRKKGKATLKATRYGAAS